MESEIKSNGNAPFIIIQKPQELIRLFESLLDEKLGELITQNKKTVPTQVSPSNSPFLTSKEIEKIFGVSRQTVNDWRKSNLLQSFKIKSRRFFFREQVEQLNQQCMPIQSR